MTDRERDRIESAIRHIQTAVDVDPWAVEIAVDAIETQISSSRSHENDAISRQAAIDVAKQHWYKPDIAKALEELPSAQPEIIRCGQCKYAEVADPEDGQDGYTCQFHRGSIWFSGSYCSWAERRADE